MYSSERPTILVVDDSPENIDLLAGILKGQYRVKVARDGASALGIAMSDAPPDLILLDVMMPEMDGYEVCRRLKLDPGTQRIPVIFVTAKIQIADELKAFSLGAADYLTKPVSPPVVLARVETHLALYDQRRALEGEVFKRTEQLAKAQALIIRRLGRAAEFKDNETGLHVVRMSLYARLLGVASGMDEHESDMLMDAAQMHDIGKIGIPDRILQKKGRLDADEWTVMQTHAALGAEIIGEPDCDLLELARIIALTHHEKWDGSGYPNGLSEYDIPRVGRIVAVADVFDALTSERPYKKAWSVERATDYLEEQSGSHFDPDLVRRFLEHMQQIVAIREAYADY